MKIVGSIVNENMSLMGCVVSQDKKTKAFSLKDIKEMIRKSEITNFKLDAAGNLVGNSKKLSDLKMFTTKGQEISNNVSVKSVIENEMGDLVGAVLKIEALNKESKIKVEDLAKIYNYCNPTNFMLRNRDGKYYITGKGDTKKESFPIIRIKGEIKKVDCGEKLLTSAEFNDLLKTSDNSIKIPNYLAKSKGAYLVENYTIVGLEKNALHSAIASNISYNVIHIDENMKTLEASHFVHILYEKPYYYSDKVVEKEVRLLKSSAIEVSPNNPYFCSEDGVLYNKDKTALIYYPPFKKDKHYKMPNTVTTMFDFAFYQNANLEEIELSTNLVAIPLRAFMGSISLKSIVIPGSCKVIGECAFMGCSKLTTVSFGDGIEKIEAKAFLNCVKLQSIKLPNSLFSIGVKSFEGCTGLRKVVLSDNIEIISKSSFEDCSNIVSIELPKETKIIDDYAFAGCTSLVYVVTPNTVKEIGREAFYNCKNLVSMYIIGQEKVDAVTLPNDLVILRKDAFSVCSSMRILVLGDNIKKLAAYFCSACDSLEVLNTPNYEIHTNVLKNIKTLQFRGTELQWSNSSIIKVYNQLDAKKRPIVEFKSANTVNIDWDENSSESIDFDTFESFNLSE